VHHDLPQVPWFALREVYERSRQQYIERSGGFAVKGYSEWLRRYGIAATAHPVADAGSDQFPGSPPATVGFAGKCMKMGNPHVVPLSAPQLRS